MYLHEHCNRLLECWDWLMSAAVVRWRSVSEWHCAVSDDDNTTYGAFVVLSSCMPPSP